MIVLRPVRMDDEEELFNLSALARAGLTSLPHDRDVLRRKIKQSVRSFSDTPDRPGPEVYLFVAEDTTTGALMGTSAIYGKVGGFEPFYTYKLCETVQSSDILHVQNRVRYLELLMAHDGPSEIGTLFLAPQARGSGIGRLMSVSRFLFMAQYRCAFEDEVVAEMRGVIDENDRSPFWEALGKHFFQVEFRNADMMVLRDKSFIADLMPKFPIYVCLLPQAAQDVLGQVHVDTRPALRFLQDEGFSYDGEIDIFEAGPVVRCAVGKIRTVRESRVGKVSQIVDDGSSPQGRPPALVSAVESFERFRAVLTPLQERPDGVTIERSAAEALQIEAGQSVRFIFAKAHQSTG